MKALTVWQPWASFIVLGAKPYEFREWDYRTRYPNLEGQRIVIHAAARAVVPAEIHDIIARCRGGNSSLDPKIALPICDRLLGAYKCQGVLPMSSGLGTALLGKARDVNALFKKPDSEECIKWARAGGVTVLPGQQATPGPRLGWIITGGESGQKARPMNPAWARGIRDQCAATGAAYHHKQNGEWAEAPEIIDAKGPSFHRFDDGTWVQRVGKKDAGRNLDGVHDGFPRMAA
jgi:hypothetical protein